MLRKVAAGHAKEVAGRAISLRLVLHLSLAPGIQLKKHNKRFGHPTWTSAKLPCAAWPNNESSGVHDERENGMGVHRRLICAESNSPESQGG